jgi:hypothetical protein
LVPAILSVVGAARNPVAPVGKKDERRQACDEARELWTALMPLL